jgi:GMP synthase-like glutamine amidotransferase
VLIRQHVESAPPGLLSQWLEARGIPYVVDRSWEDGPAPDPADHAFVVSLGHTLGPGDTHDPAVAEELELLRSAVERDVPVLGLCFGGEALAAVLGARVERSPAPELGWREIETDDPGAIPAGPWLEWHFERFTTPPGATELARTGDATQAFRLGPHLGVQFHPEATVEIVEGWAEHDGVEAKLAASDEQRRAAREAAFRLFDAFFADQR